MVRRKSVLYMRKRFVENEFDFIWFFRMTQLFYWVVQYVKFELNTLWFFDHYEKHTHTHIFTFILRKVLIETFHFEQLFSVNIILILSGLQYCCLSVCFAPFFNLIQNHWFQHINPLFIFKNCLNKNHW